MRKTLKILFRLVIGLGLAALVFFILFQSFPLSDVIAALKVFPVQNFIWLLPLALIINVLKATRFYLLARHVDIPLTWWRAIRLFLASQAATPLPAGEVIRISLLKHDAKTRSVQALSPTVGQAVYEIFSAAVIIAVGSVLYHELLWTSFITLSVLVIVWYVFLHRKLFERGLRFLSRLHVIQRRAEPLREAHGYLRANFAFFENETVDWRSLLGGLIGWSAQFLGGLVVFIITSSMGLELSYFQCLFVYAGGIIIQGLLAIIPGGLGVTEGGMAGIMTLLDADPTMALASTLIIRLVIFVFPVTFGGLIFSRYYARSVFFKHLEAE